jgi:protein-disulfide isomerase
LLRRFTVARYPVLVGIAAFLAAYSSATLDAQTQEGSAAVAVIGTRRITANELDKRIGSRLIAVETQKYAIRRTLLEEVIGELVLEQEAAARSLSVEQLLRSEVDGRVQPATQEEARAVLETARDRLPGPEEASLAQLRDSMNRQRAVRRRVEFLNQLRAKWGVRIILEPPRVAVADSNDPAKGPVDAPVRLVEFTDFACPYCVRVVPVVKQVLAKYGDKVRLVFRDFPLTTIHPKAAKASEAAACAGDQGKFWEYHDRLFSTQRLDPAELHQHAVELGLDGKVFDDCYASGRHEADWRRDKADGERYGVTGTPSFFINGRFVSGAVPLAQFVQIIDEELSSGRDVPPRPALGAQAIAR